MSEVLVRFFCNKENTNGMLPLLNAKCNAVLLSLIERDAGRQKITARALEMVSTSTSLGKVTAAEIEFKYGTKENEE